MKAKDPRPLGEALGRAMEELGLGPKMRAYDVVNLWASIVGEQIAAVAQAESIHKGTLHVHVTRSTWRNELIFLKTELITRINTVMKEEIVKDIIFR